MKRRPWSLARRLTGLFLLSTTLFTVAISLVSAWFLDQSIHRELNVLLSEQLGELRAASRRVEGDAQAFGALVDAFSSLHPSIHIACRVWDSKGQTVWGDFGRTQLLARALPAPHALDVPHDLGDGLMWRAERLPDGQIAAIVIDGARELQLLKRYELYAGMLVAASTVLTLLLGRIFFRRVSGLLSTVAERARAVRQPDASITFDLEGAPREIEQIVDALREMLENIRREMEQARIFTAGLAHELRSPVQNLVGATEVALIAERDAATYRNVLTSNLEELRSLGDAIDNLVTICSASENRRSNLREHFDLAQEADIRLRRERSFAERHGVTLDFAVEGDTRVHGDREALLRALRNLTANAIQWSPPGARVVVELRGSSEEIVITVDDAGPGVPPELRRRIFEPFFRGPALAGRRIGYGLGLALTHTAVEGQGGRIEVETSPLGGARFRAFLPRWSDGARI